MSAELDAHVAIVAGAGDGIGRATALALARAGADVVVAARRSGPLTELADEAARLTGRRVIAIPTDIADQDACHALVDTAAERLGRVDVVVNVATYNPSARLADLDPDEFRRAFEINVLGVLAVSRAALPHMRAVGGGSIVQISSEAPRAKLPHLGAYAATKGAMEVMSGVLAKEVGPDGVRVNVVVAGYTDNAKLAAYIDDIARRRDVPPATVREEMAASSALRRITQPEDIADVVAFLASPRARAITGTITPVTSGVSFG
ncbi:SDR family oxidoreductase [Streptomyces sp. SID3343]|uniref:SDR family NAD(P)-dependent oxidoreductase n=1 Tax=Streptomyces sp. SID3343 TaxID=2690260 RepID=UPI00136851EC|nr:SDR family oxidoreductase [Streptomyces sp. SID3343]MYW03779.1 SDR family oxidoreductase [Streptomyces sp. SID3343]